MVNDPPLARTRTAPAVPTALQLRTVAPRPSVSEPPSPVTVATRWSAGTEAPSITMPSNLSDPVATENTSAAPATTVGAAPEASGSPRTTTSFPPTTAVAAAWRSSMTTIWACEPASARCTAWASVARGFSRVPSPSASLPADETYSAAPATRSSSPCCSEPTAGSGAAALSDGGSGAAPSAPEERASSSSPPASSCGTPPSGEPGAVPGSSPSAPEAPSSAAAAAGADSSPAAARGAHPAGRQHASTTRAASNSRGAASSAGRTAARPCGARRVLSSFPMPMRVQPRCLPAGRAVLAALARPREAGHGEGD